MLCRVYRALLRLHPVRFRGRFSEEMLSIFDAASTDANRAALIGDAVLSLLRQWTWRCEYWRSPTAEALPRSADGAPGFYTFGDYRLTASSLIAGGTLATVLFAAVGLASQYTWTHPLFMLMPTVQLESRADLAKSESPGPRMPMDVLSQYTGLYTASRPNRLVASVTAEHGFLMIQIAREPKTRLVWVNGIIFSFLGSKTAWVAFVKYDQRAPYSLTICRGSRCVTAHITKRTSRRT